MKKPTPLRIAVTDLTVEDWQAAEEQGDLLGVSIHDLVGGLIDGLNALSPSEQTEFERLVEEANAVLPQMNAALDRIGVGIERCRSAVRELDRSMLFTGERVSRIEAALGLSGAL